MFSSHKRTNFEDFAQTGGCGRNLQLIALLLIAPVVGGCSGSGAGIDRSPADLDTEEILAMQEEGLSIAAEELQPGVQIAAALRNTASRIAALDGVARAAVTPDDFNVWVEYDSGRQGILLLGPVDTRGGNAIPTTTPPSAFPTSRQSPVGGTDVLIWMPEASAFAPHVEGWGIGAMFEASECPTYSVDYIVDADADLASVNTFTSYETIVMVTHGFVTPDDEIGFITGEAVLPGQPTSIERENETRGLEAVQPVPPVYVSKGGTPYEEVGGELIPVPFDDPLPVPVGTPTHVYGVLSEAIASLPGALDGAIVYNGSCSSLYNLAMAEAFLAKGAKTYFGYDAPVGSRFAAETGATLFRELVENVEQTREAFEVANAGRTDDVGYQAELARHGAENAIYPCLIGARMDVGAIEGWVTPVFSSLHSLDPSGSTFSGVTACETGELGTPHYSEAPDAEVEFYPVKGIRRPAVERLQDPNQLDESRVGCSSFIATRDLGTPRERVWVNAAQWEIWYGGESSYEYQVRYEKETVAAGALERCEVGEVDLPYDFSIPDAVPDGSEAFTTVATMSCSLELVFGHPNRPGIADDPDPNDPDPNPDPVPDLDPDPDPDDPASDPACADVPDGPDGGVTTITSDAELATLEGARCVRGFLYIEGTGVTSLAPLSSLEVVTANLRVEGTNVQSSAGLEALRIVDGFTTRSNGQWVSIELPALERVATQSLVFHGAGVIENISAPKLTHLGGTLRVTQSNGLVVLDGLPLLKTIGGNLLVQSNFALESVSLPKLASVGESIELFYLTELASLSIPELKSVGFRFDVTNVGLSSFDDVGLESIADRLQILSNPNLTDISALGSLDSVGGSIVFRNNSNLSTADIDAFVAGMQAKGYSGTPEIADNAVP